MFEHGFDQAAGLRSQSRLGGAAWHEEPSRHALRGERAWERPGAALVPVASPAQPARGYEWLCMLAGCLTTQGRSVVIIDGTATESSGIHRRTGGQPGLLQALRDPSIGHLEHAADNADWLVVPGARGLLALQETFQAAGAPVALSRLLAPFAPGVIVLLFAPAFNLAALLPGLNARTLVPVLDQPQATIDAYGAVKLLHGAGLSPVLAPLAAGGSRVLQPLVNNVTDCAARHLGLQLESWPAHTWGHRAQVSAITPPADTGLHGYHGLVRGAPTTPLWS